MTNSPDPTRGQAPPADSDAVTDAVPLVDPMPLSGAGGPVGGPVAGELLDALNQPIPMVDETRES